MEYGMSKERQGNGRYNSDTQKLRKSLDFLNTAQNFKGFDSFLIEKWADKEGDEEERRRSAYRRLYRMIRNSDVANRKTIRNWFGFETPARAKRRQIFKLALVLHFTPEETEEYLTKGILEPGFQINDYREMLVLYALEQKLSIDVCADMISVFEAKSNRDTVLEQHTHTARLWAMYREEHEKPQEEFLLWMIENAGMFKGYSRVALKYFMQFKAEILSYVRSDAKARLFTILEETDFLLWAKEKKVLLENYFEEIPHYLKNMSERRESKILDEQTQQMVKELLWITHASKDKNVDLLTELYASAIEVKKDNTIKKRHLGYRKREKFYLPENIMFMTDKYVSQLLGVAQQKEKQIRLSQTLAGIMDVNDEMLCPEWVKEILQEYRSKELPKTVGEAKKVLQKLLLHQTQRCHLVQREDLLPLIHYVAQQRYFQQIAGSMEKYDCEEAKQVFKELANETLKACQMTPISTRYQMDYLLLSCYGKYDMYSLSDYIEEAGNVCRD